MWLCLTSALSVTILVFFITFLHSADASFNLGMRSKKCLLTLERNNIKNKTKNLNCILLEWNPMFLPTTVYCGAFHLKLSHKLYALKV